MVRTPTATVIRNAEWVVGWDSQSNSHVYLRDTDLAFVGKMITYVGKSYQGPSDLQIDGKGLMVMPGLVNIHAHPGEDTYVKGMNEYGFDAGEEGELAFLDVLKSPDLRGTEDFDLRPLGAEVGYAELLRSGVTTVVDISESTSFPGWIQLLERSGLRAYVAPTFPSFTSQDSLEAQMAQALALIDRAMASHTGRLSGLVVPFDVLSVPGALLRASMAEARKRDIPWKIHAAEAVFEFREMIQKHGLTPIQWLDKLGLLGPGTILAHAIFFDHHPAVKNEGPYRDLGLVAKSGASVSHAPYGFALSCVAMDGFSRYREAGINVGLGTDTFAHNLLEEMRLAMLLSRIVSGRVNGSTTADVFHAATVGGAKALQRKDIGRLLRNTKADLVVVDLNHPAMQPVNDPLRSLILHAGERAIRDVYIDGEKVVENGQVLTLDQSIGKTLDQVIQSARRGPDDRGEEKVPLASHFTPALPARVGITRGARQIVNRREILHGKLEDMPFGPSVPDIPGMVVRGIVPYGSSRTLDVAVITLSPGFDTRIEGYVPAGKDWYVHSLSGTGVVETNTEGIEVPPGTIVIVPPGTSGLVANRSDSPWVWFSIHPLFEEEYTIEVDLFLAEEYVRTVKAMTPGKLVQAKIDEASFHAAPGLTGLLEDRLVLSQDFDVSVRRLPPGTRLPECGPLDHDLYIHGLVGSGAMEAMGLPMEVEPDSFIFLPEGAKYCLSNPNDSSWDFLWMHPPRK